MENACDDGDHALMDNKAHASDRCQPLTRERLMSILKSDSKTYFRYPELNDILYLSCGGWTSLEGADMFTNLTALYAEGNGMYE